MSKRVILIRSNSVDPDPRVEKEVTALLEIGCEVDILCWDRDSDHRISKSLKRMGNGCCNIYRAGIKATYSGGFRKNIKPLLKFQVAILNFLRDHRSDYDIIHACDFDTAFAAYTATRGRKKLIYDIFDYYVDAFSVPGVLKRIIAGLDGFIINNSDAVIICSEQRKKQIGKTHPKRLVVIHNSPEALYVEGDGSEHGGQRLRVVYVGILSDGRLIPELLDVISHEKDSFELHIAGFGKFEPLVNEYAEKNENIVFYGRINYNQTLMLESSADIMTAIYDPSVANHKYAAPNKFYEALMLGKPLIMCKGTGMSDIVESNNIGVCIDYSLEGVRDGLKHIAGNIKRLRLQSSKEKDIYNSNYSWETMKKRLVDLYNTI